MRISGVFYGDGGGLQQDVYSWWFSIQMVFNKMPIAGGFFYNVCQQDAYSWWSSIQWW